MPSPLAFRINLLLASEVDDFFLYLNDHLADNGSDNTGYFQPLARDLSRVPASKEMSFRDGLTVAVGEPGWRRAWVAKSQSGQIIGHVDLRALAEAFTAHRCRLGMGVDRDYRKLGLGTSLLATAKDWASMTADLEWIDLQVLSVNHRAIELYSAAGFAKTGETPEMFRLDGKLFSYSSMTMRLQKGSGGTA